MSGGSELLHFRPDLKAGACRFATARRDREHLGFWYVAITKDLVIRDNSGQPRKVLGLILSHKKFTGVADLNRGMILL